MIHFDLPKQKSSIIKVLGVGGGGSNAVNYMFAQDIENVDFIICNTDVKALEQSKVPNKIQLGPQLTQGLGAGADPSVGKKATEESLEEIRRILEVNTKMAFVTVGMGGGTGTGGAPIIAKICRDLNILTVGIVTTPFGFEGPRRLKQAEEGIRQLQPYVDTLLVISNDKLRQQYGDLKLKEAFYKADNVLATAAKCITDIINSRGHIIVDFADVCTVMKNGGVAILGSAAAEGENRAQHAIEEALNSPLLNDSEIRGAKWILININSAEGDHECTMDELETINSYLRQQAGDEADVIVGMGYDNTLDRKVGITLIATGFEHKDPFAKEDPAAKKPVAIEEKIVMRLGIEGEEKKMYNQAPLPFEDKDPFASRIMDASDAFKTHIFKEEAVQPVKTKEPEKQVVFELTVPVAPVKQKEPEQPKKAVPVDPLLQMTYVEKPVENMPVETKQVEPLPVESKPAARSSFLNKPANIYAEEQREMSFRYRAEVQPQPAKFDEIPLIINQPAAPKQEEVPKPVLKIEPEPDENLSFTLVLKDEPAVPPVSATPPVYSQTAVPDMGADEDQRRRAAERINKLRNISFNMNTSPEVNGEFENVPAYVRRNMELFGNTLASVENYYSKHTVNKNDNDKGELNSRNSFLDGKKPD
jgi:cell division protein FtsZ